MYKFVYEIIKIMNQHIKGSLNAIVLKLLVDNGRMYGYEITQKVKSDNSFVSVELTTKTDESLIGGFVLEFNNNLLDASISRDLKDIKKQFLQNEFVGKI
jgi:F-type H+-transporting ATPase subunit delta